LKKKSFLVNNTDFQSISRKCSNKKLFFIKIKNKLTKPDMSMYVINRRQTKKKNKNQMSVITAVLDKK